VGNKLEGRSKLSQAFILLIRPQTVRYIKGSHKPTTLRTNGNLENIGFFHVLGPGQF